MYNFNIHSEEEYKTAEARLEIMAGAIPGTVEACELKCLTKAVVDYLKKQSLPTHLKQDSAPSKE
ncbi:hypothetical protein AAE02nite_39410 [Adhaeribacter aerolatus]|uniref:Uncharacterized protein n=1 Tax=Adhaeribacter aerolatus TaxID=670289 RepID=A0A512B3B1_9BACT|nr:hypothetical protein [Adhaeribacter aerolatus]GEO06277.1 hypothetical protein AAE02nite_39410 [Adhaeribacter aerolatus]